MCDIPPRLLPRHDAQQLQDQARAQAPLWKLVVALLPEIDSTVEFYTLDQIAPLLGVRRRALTDHARDLWPWWEHKRHWRLNHEMAVDLIRRVCVAGKKLPSRASLEKRLQRLQK